MNTSPGSRDFGVSRVEWALTAKQRETLLADVRTRAVRDAVTRAQQYADALGLGPVAAGRHRGRRDAQHTSREWAPGRAHAGWRRQVAAPVAELVPKHIEVSATVDARFVAGPTAGGAA